MAESTTPTNPPALLCRLVRLEAIGSVGANTGGCEGGFGGPGAMAMTFGAAGFSTAASPELVGVVAAVPVPVEPAVDFGDSPSLLEPLPEFGVVTTACATEFLRLAPFFERVLPTGAELPLPRLRFLITSVFKLRGRTTPCSFRNKPHALQSG